MAKPIDDMLTDRTEAGYEKFEFNLDAIAMDGEGIAKEGDF